MSDRQIEVQTWYDGFSFGNKKDIYNPWSITCFLKEKKLRPYWANTSSNQLVGKTGKRRLCSDKNGHGRSVGREKLSDGN